MLWYSKDKRGNKKWVDTVKYSGGGVSPPFAIEMREGTENNR